MKSFVTVNVTLLLLLLSACSQNPERHFQNIESKYDLRLGVAALNLTTGAEIYYKADSLFALASLIKTPVLVELYRQYEDGYLDPATELVVDSTNIYPGSGTLQNETLPYATSLHEAAIRMITVSDNTGTNLVFDQLGPDHDACLDSVNTTMRSLGLSQTEMINKPFGFDTRKDTPFARRYGIGASTPREMMTLFAMLARGEIISEAVSEAMIDIHKKQKYHDFAPRYLPVTGHDLSFANKTGAISTVRTDAGLIFTETDTIAFAVLVDMVDDPEGGEDHKGNLALSEAAKILYDVLH